MWRTQGEKKDSWPAWLKSFLLFIVAWIVLVMKKSASNIWRNATLCFTCLYVCTFVCFFFFCCRLPLSWFHADITTFTWLVYEDKLEIKFTVLCWMDSYTRIHASMQKTQLPITSRFTRLPAMAEGHHHHHHVSVVRWKSYDHRWGHCKALYIYIYIYIYICI